MLGSKFGKVVDVLPINPLDVKITEKLEIVETSIKYGAAVNPLNGSTAVNRLTVI